MSAQLDTRPTSNLAAPETQGGKMSPLRIVAAVVVLLIVALAPFLAAGTFDWLPAIVFVVLFIAAAILSRVVVAFRNPDLLCERAHYAEKQDAKPWDLWLMPLVGLVGPLLTLMVAGLDHRYAWSVGFAPAVQVAALILIGLGFVFASWAMVVNRFFSAVVRIQTERDHQVVSDGPYRFVRHPSYTGALISYLAMPCALASWWAFIPALATIMALVLRTHLEDRTLREELPGYKAYAERVRWRLLPGVW